MNLLEIRQHFIRKSGRFDLATTSTGSSEEWDTDAGANFYIQAATRALDLEQEQQEMYWEESLAVNGYLVNLVDCRQIARVTYVNSDGEESEALSRVTFACLTEDYPSLGSTTAGDPDEWALHPSQRPPRQRFSGQNVDTKTVIIMPPTSAAITVRVYGQFSSTKLVDNVDENFWSVLYPEVLVMAALRELEIFYRNSEGVRDWTMAIESKLLGIDKDLAGTDVYGSSLEMEG